MAMFHLKRNVTREEVRHGSQHGVVQQGSSDLPLQDAYEREQKIPLIQLQVRLCALQCEM